MTRLLDRRAAHAASRTTIVLAALAALAVGAALTWLAIVAPRGVPGVDYYYVNAQFHDAAQISPLSDVRIAGRRVGQVTDIGLRDGRATLRLQLAPGTGPLRSDTTAQIRLKGLLGAKFVELSPGRTGHELASGGTLPPRQTTTSVDLVGALQGLDAHTRRNLQAAVRGLGEGFLGRGQDLNETLGRAPALFRDADRLSSAILARQGAAARFAPSLESAAAAYDPVRAALAQGFRPQGDVMHALADRRADLERTLDEAPSTLSALRQGLDASTPMLDETAGLARALTDFTAPAPAALHETSLLLHRSPPALRRSAALLRSLEASIPPTLGLLRRVDPVLPPTGNALRSTLAPLRELGPRGCDVLAMMRGWRSGLSFGVPPGNTSSLDRGQGIGPLNRWRVQAVIANPNNLDGTTPDKSPPGGYRIGRNSYPAPCTTVEERLP